MLNNKIAIVTGAARGLGKGIAQKLCEKGCLVILSDIIEKELANTAQELKALGYQAEPVACNVSDEQAVNKLFASIIDEYGRIDILVNNAGINRDSTLHKMTNEQWDVVIKVDLTSVFYTSRKAMQIMREQSYGRIINISSASWLGNFGQANYAAAKAGVVGLTKTMAREGARKNITCNVVCPGFIDTNMTKSLPKENWDLMLSKIPMGKAGQPSDIGCAVAFLASDEASYITGEVINVGGGMIL
ncbi:3-oxoacyl-ACP reductase FabG [Lonepinella koalarum]|uniref:3-oxoacyl-[acyl-carrier-protein] reductase FabG n=1 Tax=Lonepinella koalarum TaxID=53417 RepID=A0A4R1KX40_9PAST|nr:3-oxoacyl-ACP reductase FabG [Lonepinella koalarum]TCK69926.1 3-oxoacyl-[acyl-carrier-protein] reductase [Lonepinella koalarum]TFJ90470.1 3-oxoacyl-ACP reductase FabG [Lonepinella koalarum]TYG35166.1 3-oxoacyl-ACP reductase FabG [Lonepinella koalarum]